MSGHGPSSSHETLTNTTNRSTLKVKFAKIMATGLVEAHGKGRGAFYAIRKG